jgi:hypothetical protein
MFGGLGEIVWASAQDEIGIETTPAATLRNVKYGIRSIILNSPY